MHKGGGGMGVLKASVTRLSLGSEELFSGCPLIVLTLSFPSPTDPILFPIFHISYIKVHRHAVYS